MRIFLVFVLGFFFFFPQQAGAFVASNFGGRVMMTIPCTCQAGGMALYIFTPQRPPYFAMLLWQVPVTIPSSWYFPYPSVQIKGNYVSGGECLVYVGTGCSTIPVSGTITVVGSGAY